MLVHAALAAFWRRVRDHAALVALAPEELDATIAGAAELALPELRAARWRRVPPAIRAGEALRVASVLRAWIEACERPRPAFSVEAIEVERQLSAGGIDLRLRIDRVDLLASGGLAVLDYKTGLAKSPATWFDLRPQAPQIGLYVLAERAQGERPIRAAVYAQLKSGEVRVQGIAADADAWPALRTPGDLRGVSVPDWNAVETRWTQTLEALASEAREGYAAVTPRDSRITCRTCGRQALCRIGAPATDDVEEGDDA
jgi:RecB family exonuclease